MSVACNIATKIKNAKKKSIEKINIGNKPCPSSRSEEKNQLIKLSYLVNQLITIVLETEKTQEESKCLELQRTCML